VIGHSVSVMTVQASAVRRLMRPDQTRERAALETVEAMGREALAEMRQMVGILRSGDDAPNLAPPPSLRQLDAMVENFRRAGLEVATQLEGEVIPLPPGLELTAYRLVQEALTNTLKHAQATSAVVRVSYREDSLLLSVCDNGRGPAAGTAPGNGWSACANGWRCTAAHSPPGPPRVAVTRCVPSCRWRPHEHRRQYSGLHR
jgi:signal transduction histidine kinase